MSLKEGSSDHEITMERIRVLEIIPSCQRGGVPTVVHNIVSAIDKTRFDVRLSAPDDGPFFRKFAPLCPVHEIPIRGFYPLSIRKIRRLVKSCGIQVIHTHGKGAGLYGRLASLGTGARNVYTLHGYNDGHYRAPVRMAYRFIERILACITDKTIAVSSGERDKARKAGILRNRKSEVITNGIVLNTTAPSRRRKSHVLGTLSRTCHVKGLEYLIGAVARLSPKYPDLRCCIAGGTPRGEEDYEEMLRGMARELHVADRIVFLGEIDDVARFFSETDVYVSTSRWEGLPTAILEAFASGVPVVATDVVGNNDLVRHLETGILARGGDADHVAEGIGYAFENPEEIARLATNAYRYVSKNFSVDIMVRKHETLYRSLVDQEGL